jgi:hypothetical protein
MTCRRPYVVNDVHIVYDMNVTQTLLARAQTDILQFETLATREAHNN